MQTFINECAAQQILRSDIVGARRKTHFLTGGGVLTTCGETGRTRKTLSVSLI